MNCKAVVFDLDGTLLDTLADLADSVNRVLADNGFPTHSYEAYKWFVGDGSKMLVTRALPEDQRQTDFVDTFLEAFIADYAQHWDEATQPYDGIMELIEALQKRAMPFCVVTNKPHFFTTIVMAHYFKDCPFFPILGQQDHIPKKPHPEQALVAADKMGVTTSNCIFLGDSAVDMETALRAGMQPVGAGWGFRTKQELRAAGAIDILNHPLELLQLI